MKAADLLQKLLDDNNLSISLNTQPPVSASDGTWVIKSPVLVVSYKENGHKTNTGSDSSRDGAKKS